VDADGTIVAGTGFTTSKDRTGYINVDFPAGTWKDPARPSFVLTCVNPTPVFCQTFSSFATGGGAYGVQVVSFNSAGAAADVAFRFVAMETRP